VRQQLDSFNEFLNISMASVVEQAYPLDMQVCIVGLVSGVGTFRVVISHEVTLPMK
jgi:hypothetical protein